MKNSVDEIVISVRDLKKKFKVYIDKGSNLKEKLLFFRRNRYEDRWVLNGISFDLRRGEAIGLIGKNGCGKSTTLKLLTRIMYPTSGQVKIKGRVSSLIELGAGFHPDMSGRENIYTNASIFGLTKEQIDERLEEIITFSELEEYIDNPVRTYSSGMYMRLAFSVAINVEADILLIDEILAVGDVSFQKKCFEKLKQIKRAGTTIVIVSHSLGQIEEICDRSLWIEDGRIRMEGLPANVHEMYLKKMEQLRKERNENQSTTPDISEINYFMNKKVLRFGRRKAVFSKGWLTNEKDEKITHFYYGEKMRLHLEVENNSEYDKLVFGYRIYNSDNVLCYGTSTANDCEDGGFIQIGPKKEFTIEWDNLSLLNGNYFIDIDINDSDGNVQDTIHEAIDFTVEEQTGHTGIAQINAQWRF